jgi:hypothetical protein
MSFEAWLGAALAVVDSGTGSYTGDPNLRNELRDVWAHTGIVIDGIPYARVGAADRLWSIDGDSPPYVVELETTGHDHRVVLLQHLPAADGSARHQREIIWRPGALEWRDTVHAPEGASVEGRVQLPDPAWLIDGEVHTQCFRYIPQLPADASLWLERCQRSESYGTAIPSHRAIVRCTCPLAGMEIRWRTEAV